MTFQETRLSSPERNPHTCARGLEQRCGANVGNGENGDRDGRGRERGKCVATGSQELLC